MKAVQCPDCRGVGFVIIREKKNGRFPVICAECGATLSVLLAPGITRVEPAVLEIPHACIKLKEDA